MSDQKAIDRIKKLMALAERGVGGEKETAQRMLEKALDRLGISVEELEEESVKIHWFTYKGSFQKLLAGQVAYKVIDGKYSAWRQKGTKTKIGYELTKSQAVEFDMLFEAYKVALEEHFKVAFSAFVQANQIFSMAPSEICHKELTEAEKKAVAMAAGIEKTQINKRLENDI